MSLEPPLPVSGFRPFLVHRPTTADDLFVLDTKRREWTSPKTTGEKPSARYRHGACIISDNLVICGGHNGPSSPQPRSKAASFERYLSVHRHAP